MSVLITTRKKRHDAYTAAQALVTRVSALGRDLDQTEAAQYDGLIDNIAECDKVIARIGGQVAGAMGGSRPSIDPARRSQILTNLGPFFRPGGRTQDIRADAGTDFTVSDGEVFVPSEVAGELVQTAAAYDVFSLLGGKDFPRSTINPLTVPVLAQPTTVGSPAELTDPGSVLPVLTPVTLGGTKDMGYTTLSWETIASLMAANRDATSQMFGNGNEQLSEAVLTGLRLGVLKHQNQKFITKLYSDLSGNAHAHYVNDYNTNTLIDIIGDLQSTLALQFRANAKFLMGQAAQKTFQQAVDSLGRRLFPEMPNSLSGKPVVIAADISDASIFYGDFSRGVYRSLSPLILRVLTEVKATEGATIYLAAQWSDFGNFAANAPDITEQPILMTGTAFGSS